MLAQLGATTFEIAPFNMHATSHETGSDFAEKSVMGRRPPIEFVGEAPESWTVQGRLYPAKFGGLSNLETLQRQRKSGSALPFVRGDGVVQGWVVIEKIAERSSYLDGDGVGQVIEIDIALKRSDPPGAGAIYSIISGLIG